MYIYMYMYVYIYIYICAAGMVIEAVADSLKNHPDFSKLVEKNIKSLNSPGYPMYS